MPVISQAEKIFAMANAQLVQQSRPPLTPFSDFVFDVPAPYSGPIAPTRNTKVFIDPIPASPNVGRVKLYYSRLPLSTLTGITVSKGTAVNIVDLLPAISAEIGVEFKAADIVDGPIPASGPATLTASSACLLYTGDTSITLTA